MTDGLGEIRLSHTLSQRKSKRPGEAHQPLPAMPLQGTMNIEGNQRVMGVRGGSRCAANLGG